MKAESIIIIGAGIAGLAAGVYARMNGFSVKVFEKHALPGGVCASWNRKGYVFDYAVHNLGGTRASSGLNRVWKELGALEGAKIINPSVFNRIEDTHGHVLNIYTNLEKLQRHLAELSPGDKKHIAAMVKAAKKFGKMDIMAMGLGGFARTVGMFLNFPLIGKWSGTPVTKYASGFANAFVKRAFPHIQYNMAGDYIPMFAPLMFLGEFDRGDLGVPTGGSLEFSRRIERRLKSLGGELHYNSPVDKIIVRDNVAKGIELAGGETHYADIVISAADGHATIYHMLSGQFTNQLIDDYYNAAPESQYFGLSVYVGADRDLSQEAHMISRLYDQPFALENSTRDSLQFIIYGHEHGLAPQGKSTIKVHTDGSYSFWKALRANPEAYKAEKKRAADIVIEKLEERFPGIKAKIEAVDVVTPCTVERYTSAYRGFQSWGHPTAGMKVMMNGLSTTLPGLQNFYMTGQWATAMVGISSAAVASRNLIKKLCRQNRRKFRTSNYSNEE